MSVLTKLVRGFVAPMGERFQNTRKLFFASREGLKLVRKLFAVFWHWFWTMNTALKPSSNIALQRGDIIVEYGFLVFTFCFGPEPRPEYGNTFYSNLPAIRGKA